MTVSFLSLSVYGQWGSGWGDDDSDSGDDSSTETTEEGSESSESEGTTAGSTSSELTVPTIGTHYDDVPDPRYEPTQTVDDGRPLMEDAVVVTPPFLREADVKFKRRIWRRIDVRQKLNKAFTWPRNPVIKNIYELEDFFIYMKKINVTFLLLQFVPQQFAYLFLRQIGMMQFDRSSCSGKFQLTSNQFYWRIPCILQH